VNRYLKHILTTGAPDPLAGHASGNYATISPEGLITVTGADVGDWKLVAAAQWRPRRIYPTPWAVAALTPTDDLLVLNLAHVSHHDLPAGVIRSLQLQTQQFCSTPPHRWVKTATISASLTHDTHLIIGTHKVAVAKPLSTSAEVFSTQLDKTFHDLSPRRREIALLLHTNDGLTFSQLTSYFTESDAPAHRRRATKAALHNELSRMRRHPGIAITHHPDGRYTITRN
jgi:hypothetical protein